MTCSASASTRQPYSPHPRPASPRHTHAAHAAHAARLPPPSHTPGRRRSTSHTAPRQALNFAATSKTMKYKVYLTCDGKTLTTGTMDLAVFSSGMSPFSVQTDEVQVGYPRMQRTSTLPSPRTLPAPHAPHHAFAQRAPAPCLQNPRGNVPTGWAAPRAMQALTSLPPSRRWTTPSAATASPTTRRGSRSSTAASACATRARSCARRCVGQGLQPPTTPFITLAPPYFSPSIP